MARVRVTRPASPIRVLYVVEERDSLRALAEVMAAAVQKSDTLPRHLQEGAHRLRGLLERIAAIQEAGHACHTATADDELLERASEIRPQFIVLDIAKYDHAAEAMHRSLKTAPHTWHIPVMILANSGGPRVVARATRIGVHQFIIKPTPPARLSLEVDRIVLTRSATGFSLRTVH